MSFKKGGPIEFTVVDGSPDVVFEEKGNTVGMIRKISWGNRAPKLELRKWNLDSEGKETASRGYTFMTEDGPNELVESMAKLGYGNTTKVIGSIKDRPDFEESLVKNIGMEKVMEAKNTEFEANEDEEFLDPKALMLSE